MLNKLRNLGLVGNLVKVTESSNLSFLSVLNQKCQMSSSQKKGKFELPHRYQNASESVW